MKAIPAIHHCRVNLRQRHLECTVVELHGAFGGLLTGSAYKPQQEVLTQDLDVVFRAHRRVILAGDFNCEHSD